VRTPELHRVLETCFLWQPEAPAVLSTAVPLITAGLMRRTKASITESIEI
jgi:hypothetical protein